MSTNSSNYSDFMELSISPAGATIVSPLLMFITGVLGNILALYSLYKTRTDVRTTKFYGFIKGLAWTDLLGILLTSPSVVIAYANNREWIGGGAHCRFHGFVMVAFGLATPLIICAMAVERFLALKCVFFYSSRCRTGTARGCILLLWFVTILFGLLPLFGFGEYEKQYPGTWCYLDFHSKNMLTKVYGYLYACTNVTLIVTIVLCNAYVVILICKTRFKRASESIFSLSHSHPEHDGLMKTRNQRKRSTVAEIQMVILLCALTLVFSLCYAPLMMRIIVTQAMGVENVLLDLTAVRLASLNQTLDPWLYILLRRSTCMKIKHGFRKIKTKCKKTVDEKIQEREFPDKLDLIADRICNKSQNNDLDKEIPQPDVMQNADEGNKSPLPDITNTDQNKVGNDACYVCHFQFGKSVSPEDDGMFVKILYMNNNSSSNIYNKASSERQDLAQDIDSRQKLFPDTLKHPNMKLYSVSESHSNDRRYSFGTNETALSKTFDETFRSDHGFYRQCNSSKTHQSLRKTKSNNK